MQYLYPKPSQNNPKAKETRQTVVLSPIKPAIRILHDVFFPVNSRAAFWAAISGIPVVMETLQLNEWRDDVNGSYFLVPPPLLHPSPNSSQT